MTRTIALPPEVGSVWRERRRMYHLRTVRVIEVDPGFVYIQTVTDERGNPTSGLKANGEPRQPSRVRLALWHKSWEPA